VLWAIVGLGLGFSPAILGILALIAAYGWDEYFPAFVIASVLGIWWLSVWLRLLVIAFRR
jgi:hypothetical protein